MTTSPGYSVQTRTLGPDELREIGLFGALDQEALEYVASLGLLSTCNAGDVVFREGETGRELYVVLQGELEVLKRSKRTTEVRVALLGAGDWFGEMSLLDVQRRSATVRAVAPTTVLMLTSKDLDCLYRRDLKAYTLLVLNVARGLSRRLRVADGLLAEFVATIQDEYVTRSAPPDSR
jgi:CRP/FNR family cyclic AMP-dependent transcriptional regulator